MSPRKDQTRLCVCGYNIYIYIYIYNDELSDGITQFANKPNKTFDGKDDDYVIEFKFTDDEISDTSDYER